MPPEALPILARLGVISASDEDRAARLACGVQLRELSRADHAMLARHG